MAKREPFRIESEKIFSLADLSKIKLIASTLSLVNTHYILNDVMKFKRAKATISKIKVLIEAFELNDKIIELALTDRNFKDFEDGIQYYTALESGCQLIVTRNLKDYKKASIPVMSPKEFLSKMIGDN